MIGRNSLRLMMFVAVILGVFLDLGLVRNLAGATSDNVPSNATRTAGNRPKIVRLRAELVDGTLYVSGRVYDDPDQINSKVLIGGDVVGVSVTTFYGYFSFKVPYYLPYGEVTARVRNHDGKESATAIIEFFE